MTQIVGATILLVVAVVIAGTTAVHGGELSGNGLTLHTSTRASGAGFAFPGSSARAASTWCGAASQIDGAPNAIAGNPVHWVYAVPSDGQDRLSTIGSVMQTDGEEIDAWWRTQDTTRVPRNDVTQFPCGAQLDITTVRLPQPGSQLESLSGRFTAVFDGLAAAGLRSSFTKYLVYYDGPVSDGNVCGQGGSEPSGFGLAVVYYQACTGVSTAAVAVHEVVHTLGAVPRGAPNECSGEDSGHTCDNATDLLYPSIGDEPLAAKALDPGRDDYYGHSGAWPDTQDSPWLVRLDNQAPLALSLSGPGSVSADVPGLQCAQSCSTTWNSGTRLALTATPNPGAKLVRWELRNTWSTWLDPTQNPPEKRPYGSKALINACKEHRYLPVFSKRTALRKEMYDKVASEWKKLGLPGQIPEVRAFEEKKEVVYHEVGGFEPGKQPGEENKK